MDLLWGIGGTPEGVISACAIKCMGGALVGRLWPRDDDERQAAIDAGYDLERVLTQDDLVQATTRSSPPRASRTATCCRASATRAPRGASTESLVMRSRSGTVRRIHSRHDRTKLRVLTGTSRA